MKTKLVSDDDLPLNKQLKLHMLAINVRYVFEVVNFVLNSIYMTMFVWIIKMLQFEKICGPEGIDTN